jgi:hypothetical protein
VASHTYSSDSIDRTTSGFNTLFAAFNNNILTRPYIYNWAADAEFSISQTGL